MRSRSTRTGFVSASFDHNHVFAPAGTTGGTKKFADLADRFHIQHNALRSGIIGKMVYQIGEIDIKHRADTDKAAETNMGLPRPIEDGRTDGSALAKQSYFS